MKIPTFVNDLQLKRLNEFADIIGYIGKEEKHYKTSSRKSMKFYVSETYNISKDTAKRSIVPKLDFTHEDPYINCEFNICNPADDKNIKLALCQKLVDYGRGINYSAIDTYNYYFGTISIFSIEEAMVAEE